MPRPLPAEKWHTIGRSVTVLWIRLVSIDPGSCGVNPLPVLCHAGIRSSGIHWLASIGCRSSVAWELSGDRADAIRVVHRLGQTHGFCRVGPMGTGPVSDLPTRANTVPVVGYPQVSATRSHAQCGCVFALHLPSQFKGK